MAMSPSGSGMPAAANSLAHVGRQLAGVELGHVAGRPCPRPGRRPAECRTGGPARPFRAGRRPRRRRSLRHRGTDLAAAGDEPQRGRLRPAASSRCPAAASRERGRWAAFRWNAARGTCRRPRSKQTSTPRSMSAG